MSEPTGAAGTDVAIVGMAGRFPGAPDVDALWRLVEEGRTGLRRLEEPELDDMRVPQRLRRNPAYVKVAGALDDVAGFDAGFFGIGARDAAIMDPQHRQFLECSWEALETAGVDPKRFDGPIGVFAGSGMNGYFIHNLMTNPGLVESVGLFLLRHTGNDKDFLATEVSYKLDLRGPSINVQTACSTSLVAIHLAVQSLLAAECDLALAGGVTIDVPHGVGYLFREGEVLSPDGRCRAFDAGSAGTVLASGLGVVALRRLDDALADGDDVRAVIRGSAVNNDGSGKVSYLAPSVDGHASVVAEALAVAGVDPRTVTYLEAHGTGTSVGDPIEVTALTQAFRESTPDAQFCALGSTKPNIGHLDTAAGVASVIKTAQALRHRTLPPLANFTEPSPLLDLPATPFYVPTEPVKWEAEPRRAGVSSLGVGGTNAHVVLEEAPEPEPSDPPPPYSLLVLSARSEAALDVATGRLADALEDEPGRNLADVGWTLATGRRAFSTRRVVVASDGAEAAGLLRGRDAKRVFTAACPDGEATPVFLFPGGGSQYPTMGLGLWEAGGPYRESLGASLAHLRARHGLDLTSLLTTASPDADLVASLPRPSVSLAAVTAIEVALARLWLSWGIEPAAMAGHSLGELTAAHVAGVFGLEDLLDLVVTRGTLVEEASVGGAMAAVALPAERVEQLLADGATLAVRNAPSQCVISGRAEAVEATCVAAEGEGATVHRLAMAAAGHSALLDPILPRWREAVQRVRLSPPTRPFTSNVSGGWISEAEATDPDYWVRQLRSSVRFGDNLGTVLGLDGAVLVELGPGQALSSYARQQPTRPRGVVPGLRHPEDAAPDLAHALGALGRAWMAGVEVDWEALRGGARRRKVVLPTYPFERSRHWIEPGRSLLGDDEPEPLTRTDDLDEWFRAPVWEAADLPAGSSLEAERRTWWVFADGRIGPQVADRLAALDQQVVVVTSGERYGRTADRTYAIDPGSSTDHDTLVADLLDRDHWPAGIVHCWSVGAGAGTDALEELDRATRLGFSSLLRLGKALGREEGRPPVDLTVVTTGLHQLDGDGAPSPEAATVLGPVHVLPRELPFLRTRAVDVGWADEAVLADELLAELAVAPTAPVVAWRGGRRFVRALRPAALPSPGDEAVPAEGAWLVTGGGGGIGRVVADWLAASGADLVLVGRSGTAAQRVAALEAAGASVLALTADVADPVAMRRAVVEARARFGRLAGVVHAAGVLDDGLVSLKDPAAAERVLAPKVNGALVLDSLLADDPPDLTILFSSTSAVLGPAGQVDYAAANAYLDALAVARSAAGRRVVSVAWGVWSQVGMAASAAARLGIGGPVTAPPVPLLGGGLLDAVTDLGTGALACTGSVAADDWTAAEHTLVDGPSLLPGTALLELARSGAQARLAGPVALEGVTLLAPLVVPEGGAGLRVVLEPDGAFSLESFPGAAADAARSGVLHAEGRVVALEGERPTVDLVAARARCTSRSDRDPMERQRAVVDFGPRWAAPTSVALGDGEVVAELELPARFAADLADHPLHPALLDVATGVALALGGAGASGLFVPASYRRVLVWDALPAEVVVLAKAVGPAGPDVLEVDLTVCHPDGAVLVSVLGLTMRRLDDPAALTAVRPAPVPATPVAPPADAPLLLRLGVTEGIRPEEGVEVLRRVLAGPSPVHLVASSLPLERLAEAMEPVEDPAEAVGPKLERPALATDFVQADDELERWLVETWSELLGVEGIGTSDDFFELGGHSLIAVRLFARITKAFGAELGLAVLFEAPTVARLAEVLRRELGEEVVQGSAERTTRWSSLVAIQPKGDGRPFFCMHGKAGNVLNFRDLAVRLGPDQPFYGLQARGLNRTDPPDPTIEAMAERYLAEVVTVQGHGPYVLGGYSGGGIVALEMARTLRERGEDVRSVVLFDTWCPDLPALGRRRRLAKLGRKFLEEGPAYAATWVRDKGEELVQSGRGRLGRAPGPEASTIDLGDDFMAALEGYELRPTDVPVYLLRADKMGATLPDDLGWGRWLTGPFEVVLAPGDHNTMFFEPNVSTMAALLSEHLRTLR